VYACVCVCVCVREVEVANRMVGLDTVEMKLSVAHGLDVACCLIRL